MLDPGNGQKRFYICLAEVFPVLDANGFLKLLARARDVDDGPKQSSNLRGDLLGILRGNLVPTSGFFLQIVNTKKPSSLISGSASPAALYRRIISRISVPMPSMPLSGTKELMNVHHPSLFRSRLCEICLATLGCNCLFRRLG